MAKLTETEERGLWLSCFIVGVALPLIGWNLWSRRKADDRKQEIDHAHDITLEDSFPASDPPSAW